MRGASILFATCLASGALAAPPRVVVHPLTVVDAAEADVAAFRRVFAEEFAKHALDTVPEGELAAWLKAHGGSCEGDEGCLASSALATSAGRALLVTVAPYTPKIVVALKFVTPDGDVRVTTREFPKTGELASSVRGALRAAIADLEVDLATPLLAPLIPREHPVGAPPAAAVTFFERPSPGRLASYGCLGAAVVAVAVASTLALAAQSDQNALSALLDGQGQLPASNAQARALQQSLAQRSDLVTGLWVFSGVAAAAGTALFFALPAHAPVQSVAVVPQGAGVALGGAF